MSEPLIKGTAAAHFGSCKMEATAKVVAPLGWVEAGKSLAFAETVLAAVHDHNMHAAEGEFVALDFPEGKFRREIAGVAGTQARLVGTKDALRAVLDSARLMQFRTRRVRSADDLISDFEALGEGYCIVRSRRTEKLEPGEIRRRIRRNQRKNLDTAALEAKLEMALSMSREERRKASGTRGEMGIFLGGKPMMFERRKVTSDAGVGRVSSYGASDPAAPVIFDAWIEDAKPVAVERKRAGRRFSAD